VRAHRGGFVEVERLRIEPRREALDVFGSESVAPDIADLTNANVLEVLHRSLAAFSCFLSR
jgi:hypothetical protein